MLKIILLYIVSIVLFIGYYFLLHVEISTCTVGDNSIELPYSISHPKQQDFVYACELSTLIAKERIIGISVDDQMREVIFNGKSIDLKYFKDKYSQKELNDYRTGYPFKLALKKGVNHLEVKGHNKGGPAGFDVKVGMNLVEYLLLFLFVITPFMFATFKLFFLTLEKIKFKRPSNKWLYYMPFIIIAVGMMLRMNVLLNVNNYTYQHDVGGHIDMVKYYAEHDFDFPQADKALQAPQQVLYYLVSAQVYKISKALEYKDNEAIYAVRSISLLYAFGVMFMGYLFIQLFTRDRLYISIFTAFLSLTPYFVFMGAQISNDTFNGFLGMLVLYFIFKYFKRPTTKRFIILLLIIPLAIFTKISSLLFALTFLVVLFLHYLYYTKDDRKFFHKKEIQNRIFILSYITIFVFTLALLKAYIPADAEFRFVNSGLYPKQLIPSLDLGYFFSFHWFDLIEQGQSYVYGSDMIKHSFLTYQYGTLFIGEYDYARYYDKGTYFKFITQGIFLFGIIYIIGLFAFLLRFKHLTPLKKLLLFPALINMLLIIKFLSSYWVICNTDFRYYSPVVGAIGVIFVLGIKEILEKFPRLKKPFIAVAILFYILQISWSIYIIDVT